MQTLKKRERTEKIYISSLSPLILGSTNRFVICLKPIYKSVLLKAMSLTRKGCLSDIPPEIQLIVIILHRLSRLAGMDARERTLSTTMAQRCPGGM